MVIDDDMAVAVELRGEQLLGERHADRVRQALAERAGGRFDPRRDIDLGMPRRLAVQPAKAFQLGHRQFVAGEVQQRVQQHRRVAVAEHEAVAVRPHRVVRVVPQVALPERERHLGHSHRRAGVAAPGLLDRVDREQADRVRQTLRKLRVGNEGFGRCVHRARLFRSINLRIIGVKISCIARPIFPPGTTMLFGRLIHEFCSIDSR